MIIPRPLNRGSTIGIAAPSGMIRNKADFIVGIRILHDLGYKTKFPRNLWIGQDYLADSDNNRALELQRLCNDRDVDAIMAARGGYGCLRIIQELNSEVGLQTHKIFIGFSDISLLHNLFNEYSGLVTYHGPVVTSLPRLSPESIQKFNSALRSKADSWKYDDDATVLQGSGIIKGTTTGGNLSTIMSTIGTPYMPDWNGKIVFLEDTGESAYRIDRMLTQLKLAGMLDNIGALILGDFSHGLGLDRIADMSHHEAIWKRAVELVKKDTIIWANFPIGHGHTNHTIPFGLDITVDNRKKCMYAK